MAYWASKFISTSSLMPCVVLMNQLGIKKLVKLEGAPYQIESLSESQ